MPEKGPNTCARVLSLFFFHYTSWSGSVFILFYFLILIFLKCYCVMGCSWFLKNYRHLMQVLLFFFFFFFCRLSGSLWVFVTWEASMIPYWPNRCGDWFITLICCFAKSSSLDFSPLGRFWMEMLKPTGLMRGKESSNPGM